MSQFFMASWLPPERVKLDATYDAVGDEHGRGWRILDRNNPGATPNLLSGLNPSLQETRDRLAKYKAGKLRDRDYKGRFTILAPR